MEPDDTGISLPVENTTPGPVSLPLPTEPVIPLSIPTATSRAKRTAVATEGKTSQTEQDYYREYLAGNEKLIRRDMAHRADHERALDQQKQLEELTKRGPLRPEDVNRIFHPTGKEQVFGADPDDILEKEYSERFLSTLNTARGYVGQNLMDLGRVEVPKQAKEVMEEASDLSTKNQLLRMKSENLEEIIKNQSTVGYLADTAKNLSQVYQEVKLRKNLGMYLQGGLGETIDQFHYNLYRQDLPTFKEKIKVIDKIAEDNPQLAKDLADSLLAQTTFDSALKNVFTAVAIPDAIGGIKLTSKLFKKFKTNVEINKAAMDQVKALSKDTEIKPQTPSEGAGDLGEAAVQTVAQDLKAGNPIETAKTTLLSTWWDVAKQFAANPGTYLSREAYTRIHNEIAQDGEGLFNKVVTMQRVERNPLAIQDPEIIRAYKEKAAANYKGPDNTLLDTEGPFREPFSGTTWYKHKIGGYNGEQFADTETAVGHAKQLGIANPVIKGQQPDRLFFPENVVYKKQFPDQKYDKKTGGEDLGPIRLDFKPFELKEEGGRLRFFDENGLEIQATTRGEPGMVAYNTKTGKFEEPLRIPHAMIEQQGLGFHIEYWFPMKETDDLIRDTQIKTMGGDYVSGAISAASSPRQKLVNSILGWVRNSDDTMSKNEAQQRQAATYAQNNIEKWYAGLARDLEDIRNGRNRYNDDGTEIPSWRVNAKSWTGGKITSRQLRDEFERTLNHSMSNQKFFSSPGEMQDFYNRTFKRDPSFLETKAYFNWVKVVEGDRMMMELAEFRNRARLGTERVSVSHLGADGQRISSDFFDAIPHPSFPGGKENILIMGRTAGDETIKNLAHMDTTTVKHLKEKVANGQGRVFRIYDRDHQPLDNFSELANGKIIDYVYTETSETKPIEFSHVTRREGGHFDWDYNEWIKVADVRAQHPSGLKDQRLLSNFYVGDIPIMPTRSKAEGQKIVAILNKARLLAKDNKWEDAKPLIAEIGMPWQKFTGWYQAGRDATGKVVKPRLNINEPFTVVGKGQKISGMGSALSERYRVPRADGNGFRETFQDLTKSGPANNFKVAYNQERNSDKEMSLVVDEGTPEKPLWQYRPAELVDPITTMNRAFQRMVNSTFMDDYKFYHVEHWLREAEPYLNGSINAIRSNPFKWYNEPDWAPHADKQTVAILMSNRMKGQQFIGTPSTFDTWVHDITNKLADQFYTKHGPEENRGLLSKAGTVAPIWMMHKLKDPVDFLRAATFNFKLGLFAIPQFLVQAQTHSLIWALSPKHGTVGTYHMLLDGWASFTNNEKVLKALDDYATKLNMFGSKAKPGEFLEARRELENTGFKNVSGEYSNLNNQLKTRLVLNDFEKGLKIGQYPFRLGEQSTRVTAWYTAFREWREANPTRAIGNIERAEILQKADLYTVNMSRASASALNHGVFSLSTQFLSYQIKLAELFWGKRLGATLGERNMARARMITMFSALYGVPSAIGVTGAPFSDNLREHFMDDLGYIPGEKWLSTMVNEGLPAWSMAMITGQLPNVGDRFGSQGFQNIKQFLRGDIPWWQAVGGASVTTASKFLQSTIDPYMQYGISWARGDTKDQRFTIRAADLVEPLKQISSFSTGAKWWSAIQTGKWINNNEQNVTDVTPLQATIYGLTGMNPQAQDDMFTRNQMIQGERDAKKAVNKDFSKDWRRAIEARSNQDPEQGDAYARNAIARARTAGMSPEEIMSAIARASRTMGDAIDRSDFGAVFSGDFNKVPDRLRYYQRQQQMKDR